MIRHLFVASEPEQAPPRWREAFPAGQCLGPDELVPLAGPGDAVWLAVSRPDWRDVLAVLKRTAPACPVVVMSLCPDHREAATALDLGARGYCHAFATPGLLREIAVVVTHGGLWIGPDLMAKLMRVAHRLLPEPDDRLDQAGLSDREREVVLEVVQGLSNKKVAEKLGITERTVKAHLGSVFGKLGVRDRMQLMLELSQQRQVGVAD